MKSDYVYIADKEWFENSSLKNPICLMDHNLELICHELYSANYDLKLLATKAPTKEEKSMPIYNDYREKYGFSDISIIDATTEASNAKNIFLNGFNQEQFEYIAPMIKETAEILYLFKCPQICDLSALSQFKKIKGVFVFANTALTSLWDMKNNEKLKIISFVHITNLQNVDELAESNIEYVNFDSSDNYGNKKELLFDQSIFSKMPKIKHLFLEYKEKQ